MEVSNKTFSTKFETMENARLGLWKTLTHEQKAAYLLIVATSETKRLGWSTSECKSLVRRAMRIAYAAENLS
tara:strand:- start:277 stop:492 length:216 start_codon:yes stop_codon:yes gene_type:complete